MEGVKLSINHCKLNSIANDIALYV